MKTPGVLLLLAAILPACVPPAVQSSAPPVAPPVPIRLTDTMQSRVLPSGLRLILDPDPNARVVAVASAIDAGGSHDPPGKGGLAHLVEHLTYRAQPADKQAGTLPLWKRLNRLPLTGSFVGATSWEQMRFRSIAPAATWRELLAIEASRLADPLAGVDERAVELERAITEDQAHMADEAAEVESWSDILGDDATADESGIDSTGGTAASRRTLTLADARAFVAAHFQPPGMTLVVAGNVGDITLDGLVELLPRALVTAPSAGAQKARAAAAAKATKTVPVPSPAISFVPVPTLERPVLMLTWRVPSLYSGDGPALRWMQRLLSDVLDEELLRRSDGRIASTEVRLQGSSRGTLLIVEVELVNATSPESVVQIVEHRVLTFARAPEVGHERFQQLQQQLWTWMAQGGDTPVERALSAASLSTTFGQVVSPTVEVNAMASVPWEQVATELWRCLQFPPHRALRVPAPVPSLSSEDAGAAATAGPDLLADAARWDAAALRPLATAPGLGKAQRIALPNGTTLSFLRRPGPGAVAWMGYGGGLASAPTPALGRWAAGHRPRFGDWANSHGLLYGGGVDDDTMFDTVSFRPPQLAEALALLVSRARGGVTDWPSPDDFARSIAVEYRDDEPNVWANNLFWRNLYPQHPYGRTYLVTEAWRANQQVAARWVGEVVRPDNAALVVVGDLDAQAVIEASKRATSTWTAPAGRAPAPARTPRLRETATGPRAAIVNHPGPHMVGLRLGCLLPATDRDRAARWVLWRAVEERLNSDLRHATGHSQGATVRMGEPRDAAQLVVAMSIDPGHFPAVLSTIHRNWSRWGAKGFDAGETNAGRWAAVGQQAGLFDDNDHLANLIFNEWNQDHPLTELDALPGQLLDVSTVDLTSMFATCRDNAALVLTGDRATIEPVVKSIWPGLEPAT